MNFINIGGWYVGNTAVLDWIDGFNEYAVIKGDMNVMRLENGIMDLLVQEDKSKKLKIIQSLKTQCYVGIYNVSRATLGDYTKRLFNKSELKASKNHTAYLEFHINLYRTLCRHERILPNNDQSEELNIWRHWLLEIPHQYKRKCSTKHSVFQNPFFYDETFSGHKTIWPQLFEPFKLIFVHRDPLDQFADIVNHGDHLKSSWPRFHGLTEHLHPADRFFNICKKLYEARLRMVNDYSGSGLIILSFEDFIEKHDVISVSLKKFLGISAERTPDKKTLKISESVANIGHGKHNTTALELLKGREYILSELNALRDKLINTSCSI